MPLNLQPTLNNELIILRPLKEQDFELLYQVAKDPLIWDQHPSKRYKKEEFKVFFQNSLNSKGALVIVEKANQEIIGSSRYNPLPNITTAIEIGWTFLAKKYWGGKYNGIVKRLMMDHAFIEMDDIMMYVAMDNIRSQKAVEKIGGKRVIESENHHLLTPKPDYYSYRIQKTEWIL